MDVSATLHSNVLEIDLHTAHYEFPRGITKSLCDSMFLIEIRTGSCFINKKIHNQRSFHHQLNEAHALLLLLSLPKYWGNDPTLPRLTNLTFNRLSPRGTCRKLNFLGDKSAHITPLRFPYSKSWRWNPLPTWAKEQTTSTLARTSWKLRVHRWSEHFCSLFLLWIGSGFISLPNEKVSPQRKSLSLTKKIVCIPGVEWWYTELTHNDFFLSMFERVFAFLKD